MPGMTKGTTTVLLLFAGAVLSIHGEAYYTAENKGSTAGTYPSNVNVTISDTAVGAYHIQHIETYQKNGVTYTNGRRWATDSFVDSFNSINSYKTMVVDTNNKFSMRFNGNDAGPYAIYYHYLLLVSSLNDTTCPSVRDTQEQIKFNKTVLLFSDYYIEGKTRNYTKDCAWTLQVPPGSVLGLDVMAVRLQDTETLEIDGTLNNATQRLLYNNSILTPIGMLYFDSNVTVHYNRPNAVNADTPAFRILVIAMPTVATKNCSLLYNGIRYTAATGKFTNIAKGKTYPKNEKCNWTVGVPAGGQLRISFAQSYLGRMSGDKLTITDSQSQNSLTPYGTDEENYVITSATNSSFDVYFNWETDGAYEFFGFDIDYSIENTGTPNVTTTLTPPPTTSRTSMRTSTTTLKSTTPTSSTSTATTSSTPHQFGSSQNALKIAVLMCFIRLIMPL